MITLQNRKEIKEEAEKLSKRRPSSKKEIAQCPLKVESMVKRLEKLKSYSLDGKNILFIGDDDLVSPLIPEVSKPEHLKLIEVDKRLIKIIKEFTDYEIEIERFDLRNIYNEVFPELEQKFNYFITDPPYTLDGMKIFTSLGIRNMKLGGKGFIAVPYMENKDWSKDLKKNTLLFLLKNGLVVEEVTPQFHTYTNDIQSSMVIVKKIKEIDKVEIGPLKEPKHFYPKAYANKD